MLKIHQLFFRTYLVIFIVLFITIGSVTYFWAKDIYLSQIEKNLVQNIDTLNIVLQNNNNINNIKDIVKSLHQKLQLRVTIIDEVGNVIAESDEKLENIKNHANRVEIVEAKNKSIGKDTRRSQTINKDLLYIAKKVKISDKTYYIRMANYTDIISDNFVKFMIEIFIFLTLFILIAFVASYFLSLKIKNQTDTILFFLTSLSTKKHHFEINSTYTYEFQTITKLLNKVALKLSKKEKQKSKQTAKLKLVNRQKDEIISAISHEFKNPIAIISGYSETILNDQQLPEAMKIKFLNKINSNAHKMSHLIDKLRLTLKLEEKKQKLTLEFYSIKKIVENCISDLEDKYKDRSIVIQGDDFELKVDKILISMAISNLLENGLKYSDDEIVVDLSKDSICIIDKGIGIDENELKKINQKFYRVSHNGWNNSLGLGLFIVQSIVSLHDFSLNISSEFKKGSQFCIKF